MSNHRKVVTSISWSAFERFAVQGVQLGVFVFMARVLTPTDYGLVGMLTLFIVISQLLAEGGLSQALVRKIDRTEADCSTTFYVNVVAGLVLYGILFLCAPLIAAFYGEPRLVDLLRVLGLAVVIQSTLVVHRAILTAALDFKTQAKTTLVGALCSGAVGLYMTYEGYGVWSIVGLQISNQLATAATMWAITRWRPRKIFSGAAFRNLFGFGSRLLASKVSLSIYNSVYGLVIGKIFSAYALGSYTNAQQIGSISSENLQRIVQRAAYPMFCLYGHNIPQLRVLISRYLRLTMLFICPLMLGLAALAEPLTLALIGYQWLYTARLLRILCLSFMLFPLNSINLMILEVRGEGDKYLRLQMAYIAIGVATLVATIPFGLSAVCCGLVLTSALSYLINAAVAGRVISFGPWQQVKLVFPLLLCASVMAGAVYFAQMCLAGYWLRVAVGVLVGIAVYLFLIILFQTRTCQLLLTILRGKRQRI